MTSSVRDCRLESGEHGSVLKLAGAWRLARLDEIFESLRSCGVRRGSVLSPLALDGHALDEIDTAGALALWHHLILSGQPPREIELRGFGDSQRRIVELVMQRLYDEAAEPAPEPAKAARPATSGASAGPPFSEIIGPKAPRVQRGTLAQLGAATWFVADLLSGHLDYFGRVFVELARVVVRPDRLRVRELFAQLGQVCITAVPVVSLVTFLIGLVFAYLLGLQAAQYGANIFVVDGVALGLAREFSPLIVATIVAGRSGAAFTAQLGTMKLTEEIDAIRTLGLSPEQVLVVPRVLALVMALPLLVFVGDVLGSLGAMVIADHMLEITPTTFVSRLRDALAPRHLIIGLLKAPVFALCIAVIGCRMGMSVSRDTRSIGRNTTSTVVQAIVAVIVLDAVFAVLLQAVGL